MDAGRKPYSKRRLVLALIIAVIADAFVFLIGPFGWSFLDEIVDVATALLLMLLLGFHPLFLPAFVVELFPMVDMLPTWTACVLVVAGLRRKKSAAPKPAGPPMIDV